MPAELLAPPAPAVRVAGGELVCHPRYRAWLHRAGVRTVADALALGGEIVCGHPDRHVAVAELRGRRVYVKREHAVGWRVRLRNWRDGYGWVSRSAREGRMLAALEAEAMPAPRWLAYGESPCGAAVLLVDEAAGCAELKDALDGADRAVLIERLGRTLAELHEAGFSAPELSAKHVLIQDRSGAPTLLDWQSAPPRGAVPTAERLRQLAGLDASIDAPAALRARLLWSYRRSLRAMRSECGVRAMSFAECARRVEKLSAARRGRRSARDQRAVAPARRLVWLAGEAACVVPELAPHWPRPAAGAPFYIDGETGESSGLLTLANGWGCRIERRSGRAPVGRLWATVRGKPWRSPSLRDARLLTHLARHGVAAPEVVAFGQKLLPGGRWAGFVLTRVDAPRGRPTSARQWLDSLHDSGAVLAGSGPFLTPGPKLASASAARLLRSPSQRRRDADWRRLERTLREAP